MAPLAPIPSRRIACVDLPALPLQIVLQAHPEWRTDPVVLVEDDRPEARILWANRAARDARIQRGLRFREAEALVQRLHAAVLPAAELERTCTGLLRLLLGFTPGVEPVAAEPGVFFVDPNGLHELFTGLEPWAKALHGALAARGFVASVIVGFARFPTFAIARSRTGWLLLSSPDEERQRASAVPFRVLDAPLKLREQMEVLGIHTLGDFLSLPAHELGRRFGKDAAALHTRATASWTPLAPVLPGEPVRFAHEFELPDADLERFLAVFADGLHAAATEVAARREAITAVRIRMRLEHAPPRDERLAPAVPTLDMRQLLELVRLRLGTVPLGGPIERFDVELESTTIPRRQLELMPLVRRRDLAAGGRAIARLVATFGESAVTRAQLVAEHLPERSFRWTPLRSLADLQPTAPATAGEGHAASLVRTLRAAPEPLGTLPVHEPEAWLGEHGAVTRAHGPFRTNGGWWQNGVDRDYFFVETDRGEILWVFHDRRARRWYLHGSVD